MSFRHERDYIDRTIRTIRQHDSLAQWPAWGHALADEIEDLRAELARVKSNAILILRDPESVMDDRDFAALDRDLRDAGHDNLLIWLPGKLDLGVLPEEDAKALVAELNEWLGWEPVAAGSPAGGEQVREHRESQPDQ